MMYASHFSHANIPFGIANSSSHPAKSVVTRLGDDVIFLDVLVEHRLLSSLTQTTLAAFSQPTLNPFAALPKSEHHSTRKVLREILSKPLDSLPLGSTATITSVKMHLPISVGDFTDFSCSKEHVLNAGEAIMKKRFLPPGFLHFPVGYTARASSIVVSGTPVVRPKGQFRHSESGEVVYGPTKALDYELEVAAIVGKPSELGKPVAIQDADEHIFGLVLLNDWSGRISLFEYKMKRLIRDIARDIQGFEMQPLGPMNGKSFSTSISPWVITLDALKPFEVKAPERELKVASYLADSKPNNTYDVHLQADIIIDGQPTPMCRSELKTMYWSFRDLVAHQTSNGCNINTGDILATGTISGSSNQSHGCLLELTHGGEKAFVVEGGGKRIYLEDGDTVLITGCAGEGVGFGECVGSILPAY